MPRLDREGRRLLFPFHVVRSRSDLRTLSQISRPHNCLKYSGRLSSSGLTIRLFNSVTTRAEVGSLFGRLGSLLSANGMGLRMAAKLINDSITSRT